MINIKVDIIIPVYNALEDLKECISSIYETTELGSYRIIIINDCSPDPEVGVYLESLPQGEDILIMNNESNLGFVGTVNCGMGIAQSDVVLLNSDTILTQDWLKKLIEAAYSHSSVATVTPFTNNGTICSIPNFCEDNIIPEGFTIQSYADYIEQISEKKYPELPTGVGFCMYIKKSVIDEIGLFDEKEFGKGYGEENDFCCRAIEHGYKNILADDTYVYHKGSMSFQESKAKLIHENLRKLNRRYPYYEQRVHDFIHLNQPLKGLHRVIKSRENNFRYKDQMQGNALFIMHNFFDEAYNHPVGGTEYHVKDLVSSMDDFNIYVLVSGGMELVLKHIRYGMIVNTYHFRLSYPIDSVHFHHREYSEIVEKILVTFEISFVHIHHLIKHSLDAPSIARKLQIPVALTLHDYYLFCPRINLLDKDNKYCLDSRSEAKCRECLQSSHQFNTYFLGTWKKEVEKKLLPQIDVLFAPSESTRIMFELEYPATEGRIQVIEHGLNWMLDKTQSTVKKDRKIKIGFLGGLSPAKGSDMIYEVIKHMPSSDLEWHLIGGLGDQRLNLMEKRNVIKHGPYNRENLSKILEETQIDLIALLSPWPETFSYTLSEAWRHGIPVFVTPVGALEERVKKVGGGWIASGTSKQDIMNSLQSVLREFHIKREEKIRNIESYRFTTLDEMSKRYIENYKGITSRRRRSQGSSFSNRELQEAVDYYLAGSVAESGHRQIDELKAELFAVKSTIGYKSVEYLRRNNNWLLVAGKKVIYQLLKYKKLRKG